MTVTPETGRWEALAAARTRGDVGEGIASVLALLGIPDLISFAGGFPDPKTFPRERMSALLQEFAAAGEVSAFQYAPTGGLAGPRDALADRLERLQGRRPAEDELLITSGGIEALELVGKSYLDPGDVVVVEAPTYLGAIQAFRSFEAKLVAVPMDEHGLEVDELERLLAAGLRPKLVYSIPDHQNPAGVSLSAEQAGAAGRARAPVRVPDRRGRRVPRARLRRPTPSRASGASLRTSSSRRARRRRRCFPGSGSAGRSAPRTSPPGSSPPSRTPTSARAHSGSGCSRNPPAAGGWTSRWRSRGRCTSVRASACWRRSSARCPRGPTGRDLRAASSPG